MIGSSRNYAIGMAHFQIAGGIRALLIVCGAYLLLFVTGVALFMFVDQSTHSHMGFSSAMVSLLLGFQAIILVVVGSFRVASAIRTDMSSRMIESHRMMPIPGWRAVAGYLVGAPTQAIVFALLNAGLAYIFAGMTGTPAAILTLNEALLFIFAFVIWTMTALGTLVFRYMYFVALAALIVGGCMLVAAYNGLPGFALLVGPMIGNSIFSFDVSLHVSVWAYPLSIGGQMALIAILFAAACRRYRGTYATTFSGLQAILLLAVWCALSAIGISLWSHFHFLAGEFVGAETTDAWHTFYQIISSVAAAMILALIPLRTITLDEPRKKTPMWLAIPYVFLVAAVIGVIALSGEPVNHSRLQPIVVTWLLAAAHVATVFLLFKLLKRLRTGMALLVIGGILLVYWITPLVLELVRSLIVAQSGENTHFSMLGTLSPLGLLITTWIPSPEMPSPVVGLVVQWVVAVGLAAAVGLRAAVGGRGSGNISPPPARVGVVPPPPVTAIAPAATLS